MRDAGPRPPTRHVRRLTHRSCHNTAREAGHEHRAALRSQSRKERDRLFEALGQTHLRFPTQLLAGQRDVGLADLGVVLRQGHEVDLRGGPHQTEDLLGKLQNRHLGRVADVHRLHIVGVEQAPDALDEVGDKTERARLGAVAEDGERFPGPGLADEGGHDPAVAGPHPRTVGVENTDDTGVNPVVAVVGHGDGLGKALGLVVHAPRPHRVDVAPVVLALRVDEGVAVGLRGRGEQEAGALGFREPERLVGAERAHLEGLNGQLQVVDR